jgi:hypothetical protein
LILLEKYGDPLIEQYLKHMKYGIAYKDLISNKEEQDNIFVQIKSEMKSHDLKSKDMKKFIEYGWLYSVPGIENIEGFKWTPNLNSKLQILEHPIWSSEFKHSPTYKYYDPETIGN